MIARSLSVRLAAVWRIALVGVCVAALLASPVAADQPPAPVGPGAVLHRQYLPLLNAAGPTPTSIDLINAAVKQGKLDDVTGLIYKVYAVFGDPRLPADYRGAMRIPSGMAVLAEARGRYDSLPPATQALLLPFLIPPYYQGSWEDQQPAQGPPVAVAPLPAAGGTGGARPLDAPPDRPLSEKWFSKGNGTVKV